MLGTGGTNLPAQVCDFEGSFFWRKEFFMEAKETVEPKTLRKRAALDYLEKHGKATAKALALDLDSSAATASELLERCTAQGLVERDETQRPREYRLTDRAASGWSFLDRRMRRRSFRRRLANPSSENPSASNPGPSREDQPEHESVDVEAIKQEVTS